MVAFTWKQWLRTVLQAGRSSKARKLRRPALARVEGLEDRALLTAHLPVAVADSYSVAPNTAFHGPSVLLNDTDADGDSIDQATLGAAPSHGSLSLAIDGTFTYVPTNGFIGVDTFTYFAHDSTHGEESASPATVTLHVGGSNNAPVANNASFNTNENTVLNGTLSASDADGDPLTFTGGATTTSHGTVVLHTDGAFTYTPDSGYTGPDSFTFKVSDGIANSADATVSITVGSSSNAPVANSTTKSTAANTTLNSSVTATDPNNLSLTYRVGSTHVSHGALVFNADGTFTYTPSNGFTGNDSFSFIANNGSQDSNEATVTISVGSSSNNTPPSAYDGSVNTAMNTPVHGTLLATDPEGDPLTYLAGSMSPQHGTVTINTDGTFIYTPNSGFSGTDTFKFMVNDGQANSNQAIETVHVGNFTNTPPVANSVTISTPVNTLYNGTLTATDVDGDALTYTIGATIAQHGTVTINPNGSFSYQPNSGFTGTDTFSFKANDGTANSSDATVTVHVGSSSNTPPVANSMTINTATNTTFTGTLTGSDANGDALTFSAGSIAAAHGTVNINSNGSFTYTPASGFTGNDSFAFKVNDGTVNSSDALVTVHVGSSTGNTPPVAHAETINTGLNETFNGTLTGSDADGNPLSFVAGSTTASHGTATINPNGSFTYTPAIGFTGTDTFSFRVNDGTVNSTDALVTVNVGSTTGNTPPVANAVTVTTSTNTAFNGTLTGSDADGNQLTFLAGSTGPTNGTVTINPNGSFSYTPNTGFTGNDTFSFKVNDGTVDSTDALVTVHVTSAANHPPIATPVTINTMQDTPFSGTLSGTDADGDSLTFLSGSTNPLHGTVTINSDGSFVYTPSSGFTGTDRFSFRANDGKVSSSDATVTVHVGSTSNMPPVATPTSVTTNQDVPVSGMVMATDADGDPLTFAAGSVTPSHGTVTLDSNGAFVYTPDAGFSGDDVFSFKANDGTADSTDAMVIIHVLSSGNTAPVVTTGSGSVAVSTAFNGSLSPLAVDAEGDMLTFTAVTQPTHGTLSLSGDGTFVYTPDAGFTGNDSFTFKANDGLHDSNTATFNLTVSTVTSDFVVDLSSTPGIIATSKKGAVPLDSTASLTLINPDSSFANATITASIIDGSDKHDHLMVTDLANSDSRIDVRGKKIYVDGSLVARTSGGSHGQPLVVQFGSSATADMVQTVLQHISVRTTKHSGSQTRTVKLDVKAGGSTSSGTITASVS